ncbi:hypothetical protein WK68_12815 [Burkholderia ubonensis]|nr:hypothetical protein WK68_12815 [Burkholderia ubonensis]
MHYREDFEMNSHATQGLLALSTGISLCFLIAINSVPVSHAQSNLAAAAISISSTVPAELNPPFDSKTGRGGAPEATPEQAAAFAWQEFIALNWPAGPQSGNVGQRDAPSTTSRFGDPGYTGPLVWETFRSKVEIYPGYTQPEAIISDPPPGYPGSKGDPSFGYDTKPVYKYNTTISPCGSPSTSTPWINLDETDQITLANMYAGVVDTTPPSGNSMPPLVRFLAKANRAEYAYVASNSAAALNISSDATPWWSSVPDDVVTNTKNYLAKHKASPPSGSSDYVSLRDNTIEIKAGWRQLNDDEIKSGRFHTQTVRFYEASGNNICYRDAIWGLIALHIIQKTPSAPYFIYATFEQADNILTSDGKRVEDEDGRIVASPEPATATTPQVCLNDPRYGQYFRPPQHSVTLTDNPSLCQPLTNASYCNTPGKRLYYRNKSGARVPSAGYICVNKRDHAIPDYVIQANTRAHVSMSEYFKKYGISASPWLAYKLINVQYFPVNKDIVAIKPNGSPYTPASGALSASNPAASSYYLANIVVETNRSLQMFSGGLVNNIATDWNGNGNVGRTPHMNTYYGGSFHNMGGCMGCHGSQGQNPAGQAGDFSVILARGSVLFPEVPAQETAKRLESVLRNRSLK